MTTTPTTSSTDQALSQKRQQRYVEIVTKLDQLEQQLSDLKALLSTIQRDNQLQASDVRHFRNVMNRDFIELARCPSRLDRIEGYCGVLMADLHRREAEA